MGINMQGFTQGYAKEEKAKDKTRAEMAQLWRETKKENPYASPSDLRDILEAALGGVPAGHVGSARQGLPTDEVIERLGAANKIKKDFDHRSKQIAQMIKEQDMEEGVRKMINARLLDFSEEEIRSGAAMQKMIKENPQMFESINGMDPLVTPSTLSGLMSPANYQREQAKWLMSNDSYIKGYIQDNPTGDAQGLAEYLKVPVDRVKGRYDHAKNEYEIKQRDKARADKRLVVSALKEDNMLKTAFAHAPTGAVGREYIANALKEYYGKNGAEYEAFMKANPNIIDHLEGQMLARRDDSIEATNKAGRTALTKDSDVLIDALKKRNAEDSEGYFGKQGEARKRYGPDTGNAVSTYMAKMARDYVIDTDAMGPLNSAFMEAKAQGIKDVKELDEFMQKKAIPLKRIDGIAARDDYVNTKIPKFQPAEQWAKQTANDLRGDREGFIKSLNAIDVKTYSNPEQALQEYEHLLSILNRRYPVGSFGLENVSGSVFRDVMDDVESAHTWQQGVTSATEEYDNQIKGELNTTLDTVNRIKSHIAGNMQKLTEDISSRPKLKSSNLVPNTPSLLGF